MTEKQIQNNFALNNSWKKFFMLHYPDYSADNYTKLAWKVFESIGFRIEFQRYSKYPDSKLYSGIKECTLFLVNKEIACLRDLAERSMHEQMMIHAITRIRINFENFSSTSLAEKLIATRESRKEYGI